MNETREIATVEVLGWVAGTPWHSQIKIDVI